MSNNELFAEIVPTEEASLSGGRLHRRRRGRADAEADANASGRFIFTNTFTGNILGTVQASENERKVLLIRNWSK